VNLLGLREGQGRYLLLLLQKQPVLPEEMLLHGEQWIRLVRTLVARSVTTRRSVRSKHDIMKDAELFAKSIDF